RSRFGSGVIGFGVGRLLREKLRGPALLGWGRLGRLFRDMGYDQNFFQAIQVGGRFDPDRQEGATTFSVIADARNCANGKSLGVDTVATAGDRLLTHFDLLVRHDVLHLQIVLPRTQRCTLQARVLKDYAGTGTTIRDHQYLRAERKDILYLTYDAVRGDD